MSCRKPTGIAPRSPTNKKENCDEVPIDKRRKVGREDLSLGKMGGPNVRDRQVLSVVNGLQEGEPSNGGSAANKASTNGNADCCTTEFTRESVEALLSERPRVKNRFDYKAKCEQMSDYIKKLRECIKWFQKMEESYLLQQEKLQKMLETTESKRAEIEVQMKKKEEELNNTVADLRRNYASLQERFSKEETDKLAAISSHKQEMEARLVAERLQASLSEELEKARQEALSAGQQVTLLQDTNRRLQEYNTSLQQYSSKLQTDNATARETILRVETEKNAMKETLSSLRGHSDSLKEQLAASKASREEALKQKEHLTKEVGCIGKELQQVREERDLLASQVHGLHVAITRYTEITGKSSAEVENLTAKSNSLEETCSFQKDQITILQQKLTAANDQLEMADLSTLEKRSECEEQRKVLQDLENRLREADHQILEGELLRKKLHNTILELKGNIRVFCRVRPLLPDDDCTSAELAVVSYPSSTELLGRGIDLLQSPGQKHSFSFDKVFNHEAAQEDVFVEISQLVQSALDGYKVCIFAYGQTGSGKTYTMMGRPEVPEQKGLIPRSLEQIFQTSQSLSSQGWTFKMQASMLEIYNETIRDLLPANWSGSTDVSRQENGALGKQYAIKHDSNGNTYVSDLTIVDVSSLKEVSSILHRAAQSRSVGWTQMNEQSSRSHCVFTLRISGVNESTEQQVQGVLNLIDLAGSERLSKSGSTGDRLKETQAINKSLACLGDVILAIANKAAHVPYRNSKLTYLLQPCLGGDSKTLMFVNISPDPSSLNESLCSLKFAAKVNACEIGVPRRNTHARISDARLSIS